MAENRVQPRGKEIRRLRIEKGLTQEELASSTGYGERTISNLESGKSAYVRTVAAVAQALRVPMTQISVDGHIHETDIPLDEPTDPASVVHKHASIRRLWIGIAGVATMLVLVAASLPIAWRALRTRQIERQKMEAEKKIAEAYSLLRASEDVPAGQREQAFRVLLEHDQPLYGLNLSGLNLHGVNLVGRDLSRSQFLKTNLTGANLSKAKAVEAAFTDAVLNGAKLAEAEMRLADFNCAYLVGADCTKTNLIMANMPEARLTRAVLVGAFLFGANLEKADLTDADLKSAEIIRAKLSEATFIRANLEETRLFESRLSSVRFNGANFHWTRAVRADFAGADLSNVVVDVAYFTAADFGGACLRGASLSEADFGGANLSGANLSGAHLALTLMERADLTGATLTGTVFASTNLDGARVDDLDTLHRLKESLQPPKLDWGEWRVVAQIEDGRQRFVIRPTPDPEGGKETAW